MERLFRREDPFKVMRETADDKDADIAALAARMFGGANATISNTEPVLSAAEQNERLLKERAARLGMDVFDLMDQMYAEQAALRVFGKSE